MTLREMFARIARTYDTANFVLTFGLDSLWRRKAARGCRSSGIILDLCCGTGDFLRDVSRSAPKDSLLLGLDFSREMLSKALHQERGNNERKGFILADAKNLPFQDGRIDCIGVSFSFRNLTYDNPQADNYLSEILRVIRNGGKFVIVETGQPTSHPLRIGLHLYQGKIVPLIGRLISGNKDAYYYLGNSSMNFYSATDLKKMLLGHGFRQVTYKPLMLGIACIHICTK
jgi:demethylmenaquinone methyltransferase/2-methoxy-6-polyprenyl-1,4-benzoquinol methylase